MLVSFSQFLPASLSPDLVPHTQFHLGAWWQSTCSGWWWFLPGGRHSLLPSDPLRFLESVDPDLRALCLFFWQRGVETTPSCSGHFRSAAHWRRVYERLQRDAELVRGSGLGLFQEKERAVFRRGAWSLPWTESEWQDRVLPYQQKGVLGVRDGSGIWASALEDSRFCRVERDGDISLFLVVSGSPEECRRNWSGVLGAVQRVPNG